MKGHFAGITVIKISPDGNFIYSGSDDYDIKIWEIQTGTLITTLEKHEYPIIDIVISPSGKLVVSSSKEIILIWDSKSHEIIAEINTNSKKFCSYNIPKKNRITIFNITVNIFKIVKRNERNKCAK